MNEYSVSLEDAPDEEDLRAVVEGLVAFNGGRAAAEEWRRLSLFVRGPDGAVAGGLLGYTHWEWLFVSHLWVDDRLRGRGLGRELLERAEAEARARGCRNAHLDTFSFQARGFYEGLGYRVFGRLDDYPPGHARYFLCKHGLGQPGRVPG